MAKEMVQSGQLPDGIVCYNDQIAVQVMEELEKMGVRIPDDISITGYDNSLYAQLRKRNHNDSSSAGKAGRNGSRAYT